MINYIQNNKGQVEYLGVIVLALIVMVAVLFFVMFQSEEPLEPQQATFTNEKPVTEYHSVIPIVEGSEEKTAEEIEQDDRFYVVYQPEFDLYILMIKEGPVSETQVEAEEAVLDTLNGDMARLCARDFMVVYHPDATGDTSYTGWEGEGLWICE